MCVSSIVTSGRITVSKQINIENLQNKFDQMALTSSKPLMVDGDLVVVFAPLEKDTKRKQKANFSRFELQTFPRQLGSVRVLFTTRVYSKGCICGALRVIDGNTLDASSFAPTRKLATKLGRSPPSTWSAHWVHADKR